MKKRKMLGKIGFISLMLGCAGIESENMIVPAVMVLLGLGFIAIEYLKEKSSAHHRPR